jgi:hypothetical protein
MELQIIDFRLEESRIVIRGGQEVSEERRIEGGTWEKQVLVFFSSVGQLWLTIIYYIFSEKKNRGKELKD